MRIVANESGGGPLIVVNVDSGTAVEVAGSVYDSSTNSVTASLTSFSRYAAMSRPSTPACPSSVPSGACTDDGLRCEYGEECCCGECHPRDGLHL